MKTKTSVLRAIMEEVYKASSYEEGMKVLKTRLDDPACIIRGVEGRRILLNAGNCLSLAALQQYLTNSWLKFEGMGV